MSKFGVFGVAAVLACAVCAGGEAPSAWLPESINDYGDKVDTLFYTLVYTTAVTFGIVLVSLMYLCVRYRAKGGKRGEYTHGNSLKATALTGTMAMLVFLSIDMNTIRLSKAASAALEAKPDAEKSTQINVLGKQFSWHFMYPGKDGKFGKFNVRKGADNDWFGVDDADPAGKDDVITEGLMVVPVNKPVICDIRARDVIHSFFIPVTRLKQDAVPGLVTRMWFTPRKTGDYPIVCAELCGFMHSQMVGTLRVMEEADYQKWLADTLAEK